MANHLRRSGGEDGEEGHRGAKAAAAEEERGADHRDDGGIAREAKRRRVDDAIVAGLPVPAGGRL